MKGPMQICRLVVALVAAIAMTPPAARANFAPVPETIQTVPPLPAIPCGPTVWCGALNQYIAAYNTYAGNINKINELGLTIRQYERYPQQVSTNFANDMNQVAGILQSTNSLDYLLTNTEQQLSRQWPSYTPGTPLSTLNGVLEQQTAASILAELKGAGLLARGETDTSMASVIADIRAASANAKNPTEATQVEVQLLTLIWEQLVKQDRLLGLRMSEEAQYDLKHVAEERQQRLQEENLVHRLQTEASAVPPSFSDAQLNAIFPTH